MTEPTATPASAEVISAKEASAESTAALRKAIEVIVDPLTNPIQLYADPDIKRALWGAATMMAGTEFVPKRFAGKPHEVFIGFTVAARLKMDPLALFPQMYVVHGTPSISSKLKIQLANQRGPFEGGVCFEMFGEPGTPGRGCRAYAKYRGTERYAESTVTMETARRAGWMSKNGSWWNIAPDKMLRYRAGGWLVDEYCPEVSMGLLSREEAEDMVIVAPPPSAPAAALLDASDAVLERDDAHE